MSLLIIAAKDASQEAHTLQVSLASSAGIIEHVSFDNFLKSSVSGDTVKALFLSAAVCEHLKKTNELKKLNISENTVIISLCGNTFQKDALEKLMENDKRVTKDIVFDGTSKRELYHAEAQIRFLMSENRVKFIIKPDLICTNLTKEAFVIFTDENKEVFRQVAVKTSKRFVEAERVAANIWTFPTLDLNPVDEVIHVFADDTDRGPYKVSVQRNAYIPSDAPEGFLAKFLHLDVGQFDKELADTFNNSAYCVLEKLLTFIDGKEFPTLLHFLAKYGLESCIDWYKIHNVDGFRLSCNVPNGDNKTPEQLARDACQNELLICKLGNSKEEHQELPSPFQKESRSSIDRKRGGSARDSGLGSSGHEGTVEQSSSGAGFRFVYGRAQHHYDVIKDPVDTSNPYDQPWGNNPLTNILKQKNGNTSTDLPSNSSPYDLPWGNNPLSSILQQRNDNTSTNLPSSLRHSTKL